MEKYNPSIGWINISTDTTSFDSSNESIAMDEPQQNGLISAHTIPRCSPCVTLLWKDEGISRVELPSGWEWIDDWHVHTMTVNTGDGWVYAPDPEHLRWPDSHNHINSVNYARGRRWIRHRKQISTYVNQEISVGLLKPGETLPLPLSSLTHTSLSYILHIKPVKIDSPNEYSWSSVLDNYEHTENLGASGELSEICVSNLTETEKLLYCSRISGNSMSKSRGLWFCLSVKATEIGKDIQSDPIYDWNLFINSPLCLTNFLPFTAQYSVLHEESSGQLVALSEGVFSPGETVKVYDTDLRNPLHFSLLPRGGWRPAQEPILISHSSKTPSKTMSIRSSFSGRITQIILEQNLDKELLTSKIIRVYAPYWIASARCPSLTYRLIDISGRRERQFSLFSRSNDANEKILWQITEEEMLDGCTIASAVNFKTLGLSLSLGQHGEQQFGPVGDLSSLGDMDGSVDLYAYDGDGNCLRIFISSKPCPYQAVPTKVISVRPYMTFTNRMGQDIFIKFSDGEQPKILHAYDARIAFVHCRTGSTDKFQEVFAPLEMGYNGGVASVKVGIILVRQRRFLRAEIRGYEEGSRFLIVFRLASARGPISLLREVPLYSIENRTAHMVIDIRQSGVIDGAWIQLQPLSTVNFSWENPYGCKLLDVRTQNGIVVQNVSLEKSAECSTELQSQGIHLHIIEMGEMKVARFIVDQVLQSHSNGYHESTSCENAVSSQMLGEVQNDAAPLELIVELGVVGISVIDHRPKELLYLYLERVYISYSTGYDGGNTSRFKLILGHLQLDNQLPLTSMPVLLAPEQTSDLHHPVFKTTITMSNANTDGTQVFPYVYIRFISPGLIRSVLGQVTESRWRLNVHEPIIWALIEFYNKLHMERIPSSSNVTQVDPEIRIE
ncbi:hypothetical protein QJS10_CPA10g01051 [Acorus calamus]|uniref:Vacuolar protein sorting-associated protein 13 VPS13 adaptor binding domain-containing protein n=1 Tax=Acorus calamus TaxID=4465 RepID=A0AAV9E2L1_ACOCL|nr:hypothetical protein QJS10_CPA10g01051 [Acorus calamus]